MNEALFCKTSWEVVQLLDKITPRWFTLSFHGRGMSFNITLPNLPMSLHPKAMHIVFDLVASGSVLNTWSVSVAWCSHSLTRF